MSLQLIYAAVARDRKVILADYSEYSGNHNQVAIVVLNKIKKDCLCQLEYPPYTIFYEDVDNITYLLMAENIKVEVAFSFISDVKKKFLSLYEVNGIQNTFQYQLRDFKNEIKPIIRFYEDNQSYIKPDILVDKFGKEANIVKMKAEDILSKNEIVTIVSQKIKRSNEVWDDYKINNQYIKKKRKAKMIKLLMMIIALILVMIIIIFCLK